MRSLHSYDNDTVDYFISLFFLGLLFALLWSGPDEPSYVRSGPRCIVRAKVRRSKREGGCEEGTDTLILLIHKPLKLTYQ